MATALAVPPELWSEFDHELDTLIEGNKQAEKSYVEGRGMSLASIAVGSAAMRLTKVLILRYSGVVRTKCLFTITRRMCVMVHGCYIV